MIRCHVANNTVLTSMFIAHGYVLANHKYWHPLLSAF